MRLCKSRYVITALAIGGFAVSSSLLGSGAASADLLDDMSPLLTSTCSFDQIDAALHEVAPAAAARLDSNPAQKAILRLAFSQPPEQRVAMFQQLAAQRERMHAPSDAKPESGDSKTESGDSKTGTEDAKPEVGAPKPEAGAAKPEAGAAKPDTGSAKPDTGATKPEFNLTKPELGATMQRVATACHKY